ncbi:MAG: T9SS type A sorting domain-containing protein [Flavobacteriales bacterium]|nr:T9SS type A sorting domain-containing protein [Flavobacteriales bacterium]MCC6938989.1 T9SS type A sorting domain-containing protein [Flavobacteriales bacterium]
MRALLPFLITLPIALAGQTTFAPIGAKWTYKQGQAFSPDTNVAMIEVIGDTLVAGRSCRKLVLSTGWFTCHEFLPILTMSGDSLLYWNDGTGEFHMLFNWAGDIGSSWSTPITQSTTFADTLDWTVTDTAHVVIDGYWLKSYEVQVMSRGWTLFSPSTGTIIERLGGLGAPFTWVFGACDAETFIELRCYEDPEITWLNPLVPQCVLSTGIPETPLSVVLDVRPTFVEPNRSVRIAARDAQVAVLDLSGRVILERAVYGSMEIMFDTRGMYFVRSTTADGQVAQQRIVVR